MVEGSATRTLVLLFGAITGMAGAVHGLGEMLQGNVAPASMMIVTWPNSEAFSILGGEPAMTIVPNLLASGILAIIFSLVFAYWAYAFAGRKHGWPGLIGLALAVLVTGGGFGTALLGLLVGLAASQINAPGGLWSFLPGNVRHFIGIAWAWLLGASLVVWLLLFPGTVILRYVFGPSFAGPAVELAVYSLIAGSLGLFLIAAFTSFVRDSGRRAETGRSPTVKKVAPA